MAKKISLMFLLLASVISSLTAQSSQVLYFMNLPQKNTLNPALQPSGRVYIGLPVISDISVRLDNNFLGLSDLFAGGVISDSTFTFLEPGAGLDGFLAGLNEKNSIEPHVGIQLFGLAFTVAKNLRITFDINERIDGNFVLPEDLIRLGVQGNENYMSRNIDLSALRSDLSYYHETGIGASKNITDKLRVGARLMFLSGVASSYLDNNGLNLTVNEDYTQTVTSDVTMRMSAPVSFYKDQDGIIDSAVIDENRLEGANNIISYLTGKGNFGLGIEIGAEYRFNEMFAVSAALTDMGYIKWKRDRTDLSLNTTFELNGLTMQDVYDESLTFDELMNWTLDSVQNSLTLSETPPALTTFLPFGVTAGFSFSPVKWFTAGALSQTRFKGTQVHESFTLSGNINLGNTLSTTLAYTIANHRFDNLGFGLAVRGGFCQFYALVDNIPFQWTKMTSGGKNFSLPENMYTIHARLGLNLVFGNREKEKILPPM